MTNQQQEVLNLVSRISYERETSPYNVALALKAARQAGRSLTRLEEDLGKPRVWISKHLALLTYPEVIQQLMRDRYVRSLDVARRLNALKPPQLASYVERVRAGDRQGANALLRDPWFGASKNTGKPIAITPARAAAIMQRLVSLDPELQRLGPIPDRSRQPVAFRKHFERLGSDVERQAQARARETGR